MDLVVLGLNHETAPVELRERLAFPAETLPEALGRLTALPGVPEGMILSTCNRVEVYAAVGTAEAGLAAMTEWLTATHGVERSDLEGKLYSHAGTKALRDLFRVVSSLDSLVIGEPQIVAQVKEAYQTAAAQRAAAGTLNRVLHKALQVSKRVRSETAIAAHAVSVSSAAVELARKIFGDLEGKTVILVGAGEMGELAARHLKKHGASEILVANRTWERAVELAAGFAGTPVQLEKLSTWLAAADVAICAAAAPGFLVTRAMMAEAIRARRHRPILLIDIAVPRVVEPSAGTLGDVFLYAIDDLRGVVDANRSERLKEAGKAEAIVEAEAAEFAVILSQVQLGPVIGAFSGKLEAIRKAEVAKAGAVSAEERELLERVTRGIIGKL